MISVVLAAYKGEKYISERVKSILAQLSENDELIKLLGFTQNENGVYTYNIVPHKCCGENH